MSLCPPPSPPLPPVEIFCRIGQIIAAKPVSKYAEKVELLTLRLHSPDRYWILWNELELRWALVVFLCQWFLRWRNRAASVTIFQLISFLGKIRCQKKSSSVWTRRSPSDRAQRRWNRIKKWDIFFIFFCAFELKLRETTQKLLYHSLTDFFALF